MIWPYIFQKIDPINKTVDILHNIHTKAQTNDIIPYRIVLRWTLSNGRLKTIIGNDCLKGCTGDKQENKILLLLYYYPNIVQSVTIWTCDKNNSASTLSKSTNRHMKERRLNKVSGPIIFSKIPIIEEFLYGYNWQQSRNFRLFGWYNGDDKFGQKQPFKT